MQPATTITVTPPGNQAATAGQSQSFSLGSFTQTNAAGPFSVDVHWGDGSADSIFSVSAAGTIPATAHAYASAGNDTVTETVTDSGNHTSNIASFTVTVSPAWLGSGSSAAWNAATQTLTVTGNTAITANPGTFGNVPIINVSGNARLTVNTPVANLGSLSLTSGASLDVEANIVNLADTALDPVSAIQGYIFSGQIISSSVTSGYAVGYGTATVATPPRRNSVTT